MKNLRKRIDWLTISRCRNLSEKFIAQFADKLYWKEVCQHATLSEKFIEKWKDKIDWAIVSYEQKLSEAFIDRYKYYVDWTNISIYQQLSEDFIRKHLKYVNWSEIHYQKSIDESFIREFIDEIYLGGASYRNRIFSKDFVREYFNTHREDAFITEMFSNDNIGEDIIKQFLHLINVQEIVNRRNCSEQFLRDYEEFIGWQNIIQLQSISEEYMMQLYDKIQTEEQRKRFWVFLPIFQCLSPQFILKYRKNLKMSDVFSRQELSEDFIKKYNKKYRLSVKLWKTISINQKLSEGFMHDFRNKLDWIEISKYQVLSEKFIQEHKDYIHFNLLDCRDFSLQFIKKYYSLLNKSNLLGCYQFVKMLLEFEQ